MINKSISYRLSVFVSLAVIGVFIAFIIVTFLSDRRIVKENIENRAIGESSQIINQVEKFAVSTKEISSNISDQVLYYNQHNDIDIFLIPVMDKYPYLNAIHVNIDSTIQGQEFHNFLIIREGDSVRFDCRNEIYFSCEEEKKVISEAIRQGRPGWSDPFRCEGSESVVVSYISPIEITNKDGEKHRVGEVITELSLKTLRDTINTIHIGNSEESYAFLVSTKGDFITHPVQEFILNMNLFELSDRIKEMANIDIEEIVKNRQTGTTTLSSNSSQQFSKGWIYYTPIKETGWLLVFVIPYGELFQPLYLLILKMLFFSVVGILVTFLIITLITNRLVEPLSLVTSQLKRFGNLSGQTTINTLNEVKLISESLDYIRSWYNEYRVSQHQQKRRSLKHQQDLEQASEIQQSLIKTNYKSFSKDNNIDLHAAYQPARVVSGDLFDYFFIDDENLVFTIGDVSGKGVPAALFMSIAQTIIKSSTTVKRAKNIVSKANTELFTNNHHQFFLTLFVGVLNVKSGILTYCNAAHTPALILKKDGNIQEMGFSHGLPLGLYADRNYTDKRIKVEKGDIIILYTDGITEQRNEQNEQLGLEGFKNFIKQAATDSSKEFIKSIEKKFEEYRGEIKQTDDITLFVISY